MLYSAYQCSQSLSIEFRALLSNVEQPKWFHCVHPNKLILKKLKWILVYFNVKNTCTFSLFSPISSFALAKRSFEYGIRSIRWRKMSWAPFKQAICRASSPFLLFANWSAPASNNSFVVSSLKNEISIKFRINFN